MTQALNSNNSGKAVSSQASVGISIFTQASTKEKEVALKALADIDEDFFTPNNSPTPSSPENQSRYFTPVSIASNSRTPSPETQSQYSTPPSSTSPVFLTDAIRENHLTNNSSSVETWSESEPQQHAVWIENDKSKRIIETYFEIPKKATFEFNFNNVIEKINQGDFSIITQLKKEIERTKEKEDGFFSRMLSKAFQKTLIPLLKKGNYSLYPHFIEWLQKTDDPELWQLNSEAFELVKDNKARAILDSLNNILQKEGLLDFKTKNNRPISLLTKAVIDVLNNFKNDAKHKQTAQLYMEGFLAKFREALEYVEKLINIDPSSEDARCINILHEIAYLRAAKVKIYDEYLKPLVGDILRKCPNAAARASQNTSSSEGFSTSSISTASASAASSDESSPVFAKLYNLIKTDNKKASELSSKLTDSLVSRSFSSLRSSAGFAYDPYSYNFPYVRNSYQIHRGDKTSQLIYLRTPTPTIEDLSAPLNRLSGEHPSRIAPEFEAFVRQALKKAEPVFYCNHQTTLGSGPEAERGRTIESLQKYPNFHYLALPWDGPIFNKKTPALANLDVKEEGIERYSSKLDEKLLDTVLNEKNGMKLPKLFRLMLNKLRLLNDKKASSQRSGQAFSQAEQDELTNLEKFKNAFTKEVAALITDIKKYYFPKGFSIDSHEKQITFFMIFCSYYKDLVKSYITPPAYEGIVYFISACKDCKDRGNSSIFLDETRYQLLQSYSSLAQKKQSIENIAVNLLAVPYMVNTRPIIEHRFELALRVIEHFQKLEANGNIAAIQNHNFLPITISA